MPRCSLMSTDTHFFISKLKFSNDKYSVDKVFTNLLSFLSQRNYALSGADLGGGYRGCAPPLPTREMKLSSSWSLLKFVYLTGQ